MNFNNKLAQKKLPEIYRKAVKQMPKGKKVIIFWNKNRMNHIQKVLFEESVNHVLSGVRQAAFKEEAGKIVHLAVDPARMSNTTIEYIASRWEPDSEKIHIEYR